MSSGEPGLYSLIAYNAVSERSSTHEKSAQSLFGWFAFSALVLGIYALWSREPYLIPVFLVQSYTVVLLAFGKTLFIWRDVFNPLCMVLTIGFVRYSLPAFLLLLGIEPPVEIGQFFYEQMHLSDQDWQWAHILAQTGLLGVIVGWFLVPGHGFKRWRIHFNFTPGVQYAAVISMLIGLVAVLLFLVKNASLGAIVSGELRGTTIQVGTGKYFYLSHTLIAGGVLLSGYYSTRNVKRIWLLPLIISTLLLGILGGRGRAITPLAGGLLFRWYVLREQQGWKGRSFKPVYLLVIPLLIVSMVWILYLGGLYRGGFGVNALPESLSAGGVAEYIQSSIFTDIGQLHGLAGAVAIRPGVLVGKTFLGSLLWPLPKFLPIPGKSSGIFIVETLAGFSAERKWGVQASLVGDAYLNFGTAGVGIVMGLFGILLKVLYVKFREGILQGAFYVLAAVYAAQIFLQSIQSWPYMLTVLVFALCVILSSNVFIKRS